MSNNSLKLIIVVMCIVIVGTVYYSDEITSYKQTIETKQVKTVIVNNNQHLESIEIKDNIIINPDYRYAFLRLSNSIRYNRYYPDNCYITLNSEWQITNKGLTCDDEDLKIILHQKNTEESK